jgi:enhancing lycopene biosynthesis protein 2
MTYENPNPEELVDIYGVDAAVTIGNREMTLNQALLAEQLLCPADAAVRQDPEKRVKYLASMLVASGTLREEHYHLLDEPE